MINDGKVKQTALYGKYKWYLSFCNSGNLINHLYGIYTVSLIDDLRHISDLAH